MIFSHERNKLEKMSAVHVTEYSMPDGTSKALVKQVGDGRIIKRFDLTPAPRRETDIVCPHFLELKWAYGCPFDCAWCYLQGTMRFYPVGKKPTYRSYDSIEAHVKRFFRVKYPNVAEILNTGEVADSLMSEQTRNPFSKFIIPIFETQDKHKVLFLTKSAYVNNLLSINPHRQTIISFSLNAKPISKRWEKAPSVERRIRAARKVFDAGYETRIRIDPIVPYPKNEWRRYYKSLIDRVFSEFYPERITLGSLRGLQTTINAAKDRSWVQYLSESSKWGKRVAFKLRKENFAVLIDYLDREYGFKNAALCKEPVRMWKSLGLNWRRCKCNCTL